MRLARLDLATLGLEYLTPDDRDVESVELSRDGRCLLAATNVNGYSDLMLFDRRGHKVRGPQLPKGIAGALAISLAGLVIMLGAFVQTGLL